MMPRIEAGETLAAVSRAALTNNVGYETEAERQRAFEDLRRKATGEAPPKPARADPADLAAMGVAMVGDEADRPVIADLQAWLGNGEQADG